MKFKPGDKVKRINNSFLDMGMRVGEIYTVIRVNKTSIYEEIEIQECKYSWLADYFELVSPKLNLETLDPKYQELFT